MSEQFPPHSLFDHATRAFDQTDLACFASGTRIIVDVYERTYVRKAD